MPRCHVFRRVSQLLTIAILLFISSSASGQLHINEVYIDPPGSSGDLVYEFVELRGTPGASLADTYLIVLENETNSATANPGQIEAVFDLGSLGTPFLGSNGFLTLMQAGASYSHLNSQSNNLQNTRAAFTWGSGPGTSSVGFTDEGNNGVLENSGGTFILLKNNGGMSTAPAITSPTLIDLDVNNDNEIDAGSIYDSWTILDSIGINGDPGEPAGFMYGWINFSLSTPEGGGNVPQGSVFIDAGFEIEYFARWGDSSGSSAADWHVSNLTNDSQAGFDGPTDFRQSGEPHGIASADQFVETSQGLPYGTKLTDSLGSTNVVVKDGDFDAIYDGEEYVFDGDVDGRDFLWWQRHQGFGLNGGGVPSYATRRHGDANGDRIVDGIDLARWAANYGSGGNVLTAPILAVPEPSAVVLLLLASLWFRKSRA